MTQTEVVDSKRTVTTECQWYYKTRGTDFETERADPNFWLGPVVASHEIAEYGFVEYQETDFTHGPNYGKLTGRNRFTIYINGHSISISGKSIDHALIIAIAHKRDGLNSQAARFFWRATEPF